VFGKFVTTRKFLPAYTTVELFALVVVVVFSVTVEDVLVERIGSGETLVTLLALIRAFTGVTECVKSERAELSEPSSALVALISALSTMHTQNRSMCIVRASV